MGILILSLLVVIAFSILVLVPGSYLAGWLGTMVDRYPPLGYVFIASVAGNFLIAAASAPDRLVDFALILGVLATTACLYRAARA